MGKKYNFGGLYSYNLPNLYTIAKKKKMSHEDRFTVPITHPKRPASS